MINKTSTNFNSNWNIIYQGKMTTKPSREIAPYVTEYIYI